ncbi:hypothetical protein NY2A_b090R [Paramecium bursaria Chlorella virus NY2A]|uniref:Uncharacterized protein b090R n=1 Tax=Paramecium bursaria Chlorella virus NY2A TaxID=46021 RepID=A7IVW5_PBCVN|nr:hypothetical protein NY2A_b090R [Paramecium bursaria Chlorella virus NY2A]ABT14489.1 hypothetical protein NY2A_b090R [Paramecium bursaria Chlorella virus NY2A]
MRTTSVNNPDASCSKPSPFPAVLKPVQGNPAVMISISFTDRVSNVTTSSNIGTSGNLRPKKSLRCCSRSTYATGFNMSLRA